MNISNPRIWLAFFSGAAVFALVLRDAGKITPGDLATVHDRVPELVDRDGCSMCHGGGQISMGDRCLECHEVITEQLDGEHGLHGGLVRAVAEGCALCHSDHHGTGFELVNARSFALAGSLDPEQFDHELIGFSMSGKHLEQECSKCHENADADPLEEGTFRFLGLAQDCASCHEDPHEGRMTRSCAECHGQETFQDFADFEHDQRFPLDGSHADVSCLQCHATEQEHSVETLDSGERPDRVRICVDCHESPHQKPFMRRIAAMVGSTPRQNCTSCHSVDHESFSGIGLEITPEEHACSGFALAPPHEEVSCADCHGDASSSFQQRYPGRAPEDCGQCHTDPHEGQFQDGQFASGCLTCHDRLSFTPHEFSAEKHNRTLLSLAGGHSEVECSACHEEPSEGLTLVFADAAHACEACHDDGHDGFFASFALGLEPNDGGECARCHTVDSFSEVPSSHFNHEFWTGFGVAGAHAQNACESCHPRSLEPNAVGRTFGRATEQFGRVEGCASCHLDPHLGEFDGPDSPALVEGREGCARCHVESSFRTLDHGFDHELWTGFGLAGTHAEISCSECHAALTVDRADGRSFARAKGTGCADCHGFPHAGQFRVNGSTDCKRCHDDGAHGFDELVFDHGTDSRFLLEDAHLELDCSDCHRPWALAEGVEVVRYRPLGLECADCHGSTEGGRARQRRRKGK